MAGTQALKHRIRAVKNTRQITKAMEVVAANKLRRVSTAVANARRYSSLSSQVLSRVPLTAEVKLHPYIKPNPAATKKLYVVFTSDRGLAGAFNSNVQNAALKALSEDPGNSGDIIVFGRRGARFFAQLSGLNLKEEFEDVADSPDPHIFAAAFETIDEGMKNLEYQSISLIYTEFISSLIQQATIKPLLPLDIPRIADDERRLVYEPEPSSRAVFEKAAQIFIEAQLVLARIESAASEHAMRMMVMGNASRNAGDLLDNLNLELNATRQSNITQELAEIAGGTVAITG